MRPIPEASDAVVVAVVVQTEVGDIEMVLRPDRAPASCATFLAYVDADAYRGASFYRVARADNEIAPSAPAQLIQGGVSFEGSTRFPPAAHEPSDITGLDPITGSVGLGRDAPGTAGSEFFINVTDNPTMCVGGGRGDGLGIAIIGHVVRGMDVVRAIQSMETPPMPPTPGIEGQMLRRPVAILAIARLDS